MSWAKRFRAMRLCAAAAQQADAAVAVAAGAADAGAGVSGGREAGAIRRPQAVARRARAVVAELRVEVHALDAAGAKVRLLCCNASTGLSELEEAWLVRSLYREDRLSQPQIARAAGSAQELGVPASGAGARACPTS